MAYANKTSDFKIGFTERGDADRDLSWLPKLLGNDNLKGAVLITKSAQDRAFQDAALEANAHKPCVLHAGITGWGGTRMEPGVYSAETVLAAVRHLIDAGFPASRTVLRIDPIIPTVYGITRATQVLQLASTYLPDVSRVRISIYDDYFAGRTEMVKRGFPAVDGIIKWKSEQERRPTQEWVKSIAETLVAARPDQIFECCAEPELCETYPDHFVAQGCCSQADITAMGLELPREFGVNGQNRHGCLCLRCKTELLEHKNPCPNDCAYCYWRKTR